MAWWRFSFSLYTNYVYLYILRLKSSPDSAPGVPNGPQAKACGSVGANESSLSRGLQPTGYVGGIWGGCLRNAAEGLVEGVALGGCKTRFFDHGEEIVSSGGVVGACRAHDVFFNHDAAHIVGSKVKRYLGNR